MHERTLPPQAALRYFQELVVRCWRRLCRCCHCLPKLTPCRVFVCACACIHIQLALLNIRWWHALRAFTYWFCRYREQQQRASFWLLWWKTVVIYTFSCANTRGLCTPRTMHYVWGKYTRLEWYNGNGRWRAPRERGDARRLVGRSVGFGSQGTTAATRQTVAGLTGRRVSSPNDVKLGSFNNIIDARVITIETITPPRIAEPRIGWVGREKYAATHVARARLIVLHTFGGRNVANYNEAVRIIFVPFGCGVWQLLGGENWLKDLRRGRAHGI